MKKIGFIGIGNMGFAMLKGAMNIFDSSELIYTDNNTSRMNWVKEQTGILFANDIKSCVKDTKMIILAVKPQQYEEVLIDIKEHIKKSQIIISIAPGISIKYIEKILGIDVKIVRAMPNTPALVMEGQTAITYKKEKFLRDEQNLITNFFTSFGKLTFIEEYLMDSIVPITSSSPAYVFMFIEALADSAVKLGIQRDKAYEMIAQTVLGSAKMVLETKEHPAILKDKVCSPSGTTIEAVSELEKQGFRNAVIQSVDKCYLKCKDINNVSK